MNRRNADKMYMDFAIRVSEESYCKRKKVGAILVKNISVIAYGYNGTPSGEVNCCETEFGVTKPNVIHAEDNAYRKLARSTETSVGTTLYTTLSPCERCANIIADSGTMRVVYLEKYCDVGLNILRNKWIVADQFLA